MKQYDREDFEDPPKKQVNICFYSDEAETLHSQQMEYLIKRDDEESFEADEYRKRQALVETLQKTNYTLTREAIEKCVLNTPFCGGEIGDFDINVETTNQKDETTKFKLITLAQPIISPIIAMASKCQ